jgi:hypothetical protein
MCVSTSSREDQTELVLPDQECEKSTRPEEVEPCPELPICEASSEMAPIVYTVEKNSAFYNISPYEREEVGVASTTTDRLGSTEVEPEILEFDNVVDVDNTGEGSVLNGKSKWQVSKWSQCAAGRRTRKVFCPGSREPPACNVDSKPLEVEECRTGKWATGASLSALRHLLSSKIFSRTFLCLRAHKNFNR